MTIKERSEFILTCLKTLGQDGNHESIQKDIDEYFPIRETLIVPWCSIWLCERAHENNLVHPKSAVARHWLNVGESALAYENGPPEPGDIAVFWRERPNSWKGHVAVYLSSSEYYIQVLSGNYENKVQIHWLPKTRLLGIRRLHSIA